MTTAMTACETCLTPLPVAYDDEAPYSACSACASLAAQARTSRMTAETLRRLADDARRRAEDYRRNAALAFSAAVEADERALVSVADAERAEQALRDRESDSEANERMADSLRGAA